MTHPKKANEILEKLLQLPNSFVCKSFSKAFGLADLRIGYILSNTKNIITQPKQVSKESKLAVLKILNNLKDYKSNAIKTVALNSQFSPHYTFCNFMTFPYYLTDFENNFIAVKKLNGNGMRVTTNKLITTIFDNSLQKLMFHFNIQPWCINLESRKDRLLHSQAQFKKIGLDVNYLHPSKHSDGTLGCWQSHFDLIKKLAVSEFDYFLIFEDDIYFDLKSKHLKNLKQNLQEKPNLLFLGATIFKYKTKTKLYNTAYFMGAHAYIISKKEALSLVKFDYTSFYKKHTLGIDDYFTLFYNPRILKNTFCFQKTINESDTVWDQTDSSLQKFYSSNNVLKQKIGNLFGNPLTFKKYKKIIHNKLNVLL